MPELSDGEDNCLDDFIISWEDSMALGKQAKILTDKQVDAMVAYLGTRRNPIRNTAIFLLSVKAGLRATEIAGLKWSMVLTADGVIGDSIHLTDEIAKGRSGRIVPMHKTIKCSLEILKASGTLDPNVCSAKGHIVRTERSERTSPQAIVNMFARWYAEIGYTGCSSHSGRRTFITNLSRKIGLVGGSIRDVQVLAGHRNLQTTQRYIEMDTASQKKAVSLL